VEQHRQSQSTVVAGQRRLADAASLQCMSLAVVGLEAENAELRGGGGGGGPMGMGFGDGGTRGNPNVGSYRDVPGLLARAFGPMGGGGGGMGGGSGGGGMGGGGGVGGQPQQPRFQARGALPMTQNNPASTQNIVRGSASSAAAAAAADSSFNITIDPFRQTGNGQQQMLGAGITMNTSRSEKIVHLMLRVIDKVAGLNRGDISGFAFVAAPPHSPSNFVKPLWGFGVIPGLTLLATDAAYAVEDRYICSGWAQVSCEPDATVGRLGVAAN
jgi:hypothetical protein